MKLPRKNQSPAPKKKQDELPSAKLTAAAPGENPHVFNFIEFLDRIAT